MSISELLKLNLAKESDSTNSKGTLLVIEDDPLQVDLFSAVLQEYRLIPVSTISAGLEVLRHHSPDVILMDHILGDGQRGGGPRSSAQKGGTAGSGHHYFRNLGDSRTTGSASGWLVRRLRPRKAGGYQTTHPNGGACAIGVRPAGSDSAPAIRRSGQHPG